MPTKSNKQPFSDLGGNPNHGLNWIRKEKRYAIYLRDGMACAYCERDLTGEQDGGVCTLDHLDPNGGNHESNLVTACRPCNTAKAGAPVSAFAGSAAKERIATLLTKSIDVPAAREFLASRNASAGAERDAQSMRVSIKRMAEMARTTDKRLLDLAQRGLIPAPTAEGYDATGVLCAMMDLRSAPSDAEQLAKDKARKARVEADSAELAYARDSERVVLAEDADATLADYGTAVRSVIESARYLSEDGRAKLLAAVRSIDIELAPAASGAPRKSTAKK